MVPLIYSGRGTQIRDGKWENFYFFEKLQAQHNNPLSNLAKMGKKNHRTSARWQVPMKVNVKRQILQAFLTRFHKHTPKSRFAFLTKTSYMEICSYSFKNVSFISTQCCQYGLPHFPNIKRLSLALKSTLRLLREKCFLFSNSLSLLHIFVH